MHTERQNEIIDCSIEIIDKKGIQGLTIKNISKEIGISEPAIYRHFKSKTDIILAILENFKIMADFLSDTMDNFEGEAVEKISFMFSKMLEMFSNQPSIVSVIFSEEIFKNEEILKEKIVEIMDVKEKTIEDIILDGQNKGEVRTDIDNKTLALIVIGALRFRIKQWDLRNQHQDLLQEGQSLIKALKIILE